MADKRYTPEELQEILKLHELWLGKEEGAQTGTAMTEPAFKYDICLSFAAEDCEYVEKVAAHLLSLGVTVFYDKYEQADLGGKDLYIPLDEVYRKTARYCIVFISEHYGKKLSTNYERKSAQARAFTENNEYLLPARFDATAIPGILPTIGFISLKGLTPETFSGLVKSKLEAKIGSGTMTRRSEWKTRFSKEGATLPDNFAELFPDIAAKLQAESEVEVKVTTLPEFPEGLPASAGLTLTEILTGKRGAEAAVDAKDRLRALRHLFTAGSLNGAAKGVEGDYGDLDHSGIRSRVLTLAKTLEVLLFTTIKHPGCRAKTVLTPEGKALGKWISQHPEHLA